MQKRFVGLVSQPRNYRNSAIAEYEKGIVRIAHDTRQFLFEDPIRQVDYLSLVEITQVPLLQA